MEYAGIVDVVEVAEHETLAPGPVKNLGGVEDAMGVEFDSRNPDRKGQIQRTARLQHVDQGVEAAEMTRGIDAIPVSSQPEMFEGMQT